MIYDGEKSYYNILAELHQHLVLIFSHIVFSLFTVAADALFFYSVERELEIFEHAQWMMEVLN